MKKTNENISNNNKFLKESPNENGVSESHNTYLGLKTPEDYFSKSKNDILNSLKEGDEKKSFRINSKRVWAIAATVTLLITVSLVWFQDSIFKGDNIAVIDEYEVTSDNILLSSLFVEDSEADAFIEDSFLDEVASELDELENSSESVILNSLFVDDSLTDEFIDDYLIEEIVL